MVRGTMAIRGAHGNMPQLELQGPGGARLMENLEGIMGAILSGNVR